MLVLSRQRDETIMIGDDIEVTVVDIRGDKVRLGITAPKEISVHRKEVYDAIRRENRAAAQVRPEDLSGLGKVKPKSPPAAQQPQPPPGQSPGHQQPQPPGTGGHGSAQQQQQPPPPPHGKSKDDR
jgi:carbon storage regulator